MSATAGTSPAGESRLRSLRELPKAHLHLHLDGSFPREPVERLVSGPPLSFPPESPFADEWDFFERYMRVPAAVPSVHILADLCRRLILAEAAQGVVYCEPAVEPQLYAPRLGSTEEVLKVMCEGFAAGAAETGIEVGALVTANTDGPALGDGRELAEVSARFAGRGVVAYGTAGFVEPGGRERFKGAVALARSAGLKIAAHAGQTSDAYDVVAALDLLAPDRIEHGVRAARDGTVMRRLQAEGVVCDVCLSSNVLLGVVPALEDHPLPAMLGAGVLVTLNADDELWTGSGIADEYETARTVFGLSDEQLASIAVAGCAASGMSGTTRRRLEAGAQAWLEAGPSAA